MFFRVAHSFGETGNGWTHTRVVLGSAYEGDDWRKSTTITEKNNETTGGIRHCEDLVLHGPGVMSPHPTRAERRVTPPTTTEGNPRVCPNLPESCRLRRRDGTRRHRHRGKCELSRTIVSIFLSHQLLFIFCIIIYPVNPFMRRNHAYLSYGGRRTEARDSSTRSPPRW